MIQKVTQSNIKPTINKKYTSNPNIQNQSTSKYKKNADTFFKHAKESTPMLLAATSVLTVLSLGSEKLDVKTPFKKNMLKYFLPVLIGSSALLTYIENKKT